MDAAGLLALTLLPSAFWFWLFVRRDLHPEPAWLLARTFAYGAVAWGLATVLELSVRALPLGVALVVASALIEEGAKFLATSTAAREREFDEPIDGLVYAVTAALAFATLESVGYAFGYGAGVALWHGLVTTLAHALFSAPMGYGLALARFRGGRWWRTRGLLASVALHVAFNGLLTGAGNWMQYAAFSVAFVLMVVLAWGLYDRLGQRRPR